VRRSVHSRLAVRPLNFGAFMNTAPEAAPLHIEKGWIHASLFSAPLGSLQSISTIRCNVVHTLSA
jgi:hypothetical protein